MALLVLLGLALAAAGLPCAPAAYPPLDLPVFALSELQAPTAATLTRVGAAVSDLGMFAVTGDFACQHIAHQALSQFVACAAAGNLALRKVTMDDGTRRNTLATATNASVPQPLPADVELHCPDFATAAARLRSAVATAGRAYAGVLDRLLYGDAACAAPDQCFTSAVLTAEGLEHFHFFEPAASKATSAVPPHMLEMHADIGLFLVMSPAELFDHAGAAEAVAATAAPARRLAAANAKPRAGRARAASGDDDGVGAPTSAPRRANDLVVQLADGKIVAPVLPDGALLVMNGEGLTRWMRASSSPGRPHPYSPLHEVLSSDMGGGVRAWFGRMFMPARSALLQGADVDASLPQPQMASRPPSSAPASTSSRLTFGAYREHTHAMFRDGLGQEASAAGCSPTRRRLADEGSCGANEVYCWHSCMAMPANTTCSKTEAVCANINDPSMLWPRDYTSPGSNKVGHCMECGVMCPKSSAPTSASSFCSTLLEPTTMWMTGFQFAAGNENDPCVVFLFPGWVLDSAGKFAGACIGTFFLGVAIGALGWAREQLRQAWEARGLWEPRSRSQPLWRVWAADAALVGIIAVQVCVGYWLMLIAMTYQAELFIMVVLGIAAGHVFYRPRPSAAAVAAKDGDRKKDGYALQEPAPCCSVAP